MLPGVNGGTFVDLGGGLTEGLRAGSENVRCFKEVHAVHFGSKPAAPSAADAKTKLHEHELASPNADVPADIGVAPGSADVVTISHNLVCEDDWQAKLQLATTMLKPGGFLAVADLAPASGNGYLAAAKAAFWAAARPRGTAPHHAAVVEQLKAMTSEVHTDAVAPSMPMLTRTPIVAPHFVYVGRA